VDLIADIVLNPAFDPDRDRGRARRDPAGDRAGRRHARRHHLRLAAGRGLSRTAAGPHDPRPRRARARVQHRGDFDRFVAEHYGPERADPVGRRGVDPERSCAWPRPPSGISRRSPAATPSPRASRVARSAWSRTWSRRISRWRWRRRATGPTISTPRRSTPPRWAAACPRGCSRRSANDAGLCYTIYAQVGAFDDTGMLTIYAGTSGEQIGDLVGPDPCRAAPLGR
jgi:hypothetical protein